ncbi:MAG: ATP-binding protein [Halarchaeum sp.]
MLTVRDDGSGIAPVEAAAVERERESAVVHGGGLGLWLVNWIVTRYGGSFAVEARDGDGGGTTATVRLPAVGDADSLADAARPPTLLSR